MKSIMTEIKEILIKWKDLYMSDVKNNSIHLAMILLVMLFSYRYGYILILMIAGLIHYYHYRFKEFSLNQSQPKNLIFALLFALFIFLGSQKVLINGNYLLLPSGNSFIGILVYTLGFAVMEELFFRGYLAHILNGKTNKAGLILIVTVVYGLYMQSMIGLVLGLGLMLLYVYSDSIYPGIFASFALRCFLYLEQSNPQLFEPLAQFFVQGGEIQTFALQLIVLGFLSIAIGLCLKCKPMENKEKDPSIVYPVAKPTHHKRIYKRKFVR